MTRVRVDMNLCQSNGQCELAAPEIFEFGNGDLPALEGGGGRPVSAPEDARGGRGLSDASDPRGGLIGMPQLEKLAGAVVAA